MNVKTQVPPPTQMSINTKLIFDEVVEMLIPRQTDRREYIRLLARADQYVQREDYRGLLRMWSDLSSPSPAQDALFEALEHIDTTSSISSAPVTLKEEEESETESETETVSDDLGFEIAPTREASWYDGYHVILKTPNAALFYVARVLKVIDDHTVFVQWLDTAENGDYKVMSGPRSLQAVTTDTVLARIQRPPRHDEVTLILDHLKELAQASTPPLQRADVTRVRYRLSKEQVDVLTHHFTVEKDYWPSRYIRKTLAKMFRIPEESIYNWFANARHRHKVTHGCTETEWSKMDPERERQCLLRYRRLVHRPRMPISSPPSLLN